MRADLLKVTTKYWRLSIWIAYAGLAEIVVTVWGK